MKKVIALIILLPCLISLFSGCGLKRVFSDGVSKAYYTDDDYHFKVTYPSTFSGPETNYLDEDENEVEYKFKNGDELIHLTCLFNKESNFYNYIVNSGFDKRYIKFKTAHSFVYDTTGTDNPGYKIVMATKKMIYTLDYTSSDMSSQAYISNLEFVDIEFTTYANVPKENATLSDGISLADTSLTVRVPADCDYILTPVMQEVPYKTVEVEVEEDGETVKKEEKVIDTDKYRGIIISNSEYIFNFSSPIDGQAPYKPEQINEGAVSAVTAERAQTMLFSKATDVKLDGQAQYRTVDGKSYFICGIVCSVDGREYKGTYSVGYTKTGVCFEYTYVSTSLTEGENSQFMAVIESAQYK